MRHPAGIAFISPGPAALGGISTVVENYKSADFWDRWSCFHYGTCDDSLGPLAGKAFQLWRMFRFLFLLAFRPPRLLVIHTSSRSSFYRKYCYFLMGRLFGIPVVAHIHPSHFHDFFLRAGSPGKAMIRSMFRGSEAVVFLSREIADLFKAEIPPEKTFVISNPVVYRLYQDSTAFSTPPASYGLLYMGWFIRTKGVFDIVRVIPRIIRNHPNARFVFAGNKEVESLRKAIRAEGVEANTHVLEWVKGQAKIDMLRSSRILLLPTYTEGIPNILLEAMAAGLPIITTPVGGIPSIFKEGDNGYYVHPGNLDELAGRIEWFMNHEDERLRIAARSRETIKATNDIEVIGNQLEDLLKRFSQS